MTDKIFVNGLIVKPPRENAPSFVKCSISIRRDELTDWLNKQEGEWVNVDVKEAKSGKWYAEVNTWKPDKQKGKAEQKPEFDDSLDF